MTTTSALSSDRDPSRAHWMELFFDLIFVALVGQLAHGLHVHPGFDSLGVFLALFAAVWWAWVNLTFVVDVSPALTRRALAGAMLVAMLAVGAIAVAAPEAVGDRAWLFAAGNALLRVLLLVLWVSTAWGDGTASRVRILAYNGLTAVLWIVSIALPHPWDYALWAVAIALEVTLLLLTTSRASAGAFDRLNAEHLSERFGLLVIIVLGESVLSSVAAVSETWTVAGGLVGALGLVLLTGLAWSFFLYSVDAMREGLLALQAAGRVTVIRDTIGFLPFMIVAGITAISGALAAGILHPDDPLPPALATALGGGVALFYLTNAIIARRFGDSWGRVLRWAIPAVALPALLIPVAMLIPASAAVGAAVVVQLFIVALGEWGRRRNERASSAAHASSSV